MKLVLCGYHQAGADVLLQATNDPTIDVFLFTHAPEPHAPDLRNIADSLGVPWTTDSVNGYDLPFEPDVISSVYYRKIIDQAMISRVGGRIFNAHPSLLPRHRGCSSVPWSIIEGDSETGVTYHYIDERIDTGRILLQDRIPITSTTTAFDLYYACMIRAAAQWRQALQMVIEEHAGRPQSEFEHDPCYHVRGVPYDGRIDASWSDQQIDRFVRAMTFPPLPYATVGGIQVRTLQEARDEIERRSAGGFTDSDFSG